MVNGGNGVNKHSNTNKQTFEYTPKMCDAFQQSLNSLIIAYSGKHFI